MTTSPDDPRPLPPLRLTLPVLVILLALAVKLGFTLDTWRLLKATGEDLHVRQTLSVYALHLGHLAAIWIVSRLRPSQPKVIVLTVLLALMALTGINSAAAIQKVQAANGLSWSGWIWRVQVHFVANLVIAAGAFWGFFRLQPWHALRRTEGPLSPTTRKAKRLFGISGLVAILAVAAVGIGARGEQGNAVWSNSQNIPPALAFVAIALWLIGMALSWWWYFIADEHERRANDVGFLAGGGLFIAVTPVWWLAHRAGLLPPPDAMILWYATLVAVGLGWWRYRSR